MAAFLCANGIPTIGDSRTTKLGTGSGTRERGVSRRGSRGSEATAAIESLPEPEALQNLLKPGLIPNRSEVGIDANKGCEVVAGRELLGRLLEVVESPFMIVDPHVGEGDLRPSRCAFYDAPL